MPREIRFIQGDPQPHESVLLPDDVTRVRVISREPRRVGYRRERDGLPAVELTASMTLWPDIIEGGTPIEPAPGFLIRPRTD
jgi:hypothetical protein